MNWRLFAEEHAAELDGCTLLVRIPDGRHEFLCAVGIYCHEYCAIRDVDKDYIEIPQGSYYINVNEIK